MDRAHRVDVLFDELDRDIRHVRRVFDQPAQTVGGGRDQWKAEGRGFALDVVGGVKQTVSVDLAEAAFADRLARLVEPVAFGLHP